LDAVDPKSQGEITRLLLLWRQGSPGSLDRLFPIVYHELKRLARRQLAGSGPGRTLYTTGLVHEAYLKLVDQTRAEINDRHHFFAPRPGDALVLVDGTPASRGQARRRAAPVDLDELGSQRRVLTDRRGRCLAQPARAARAAARQGGDAPPASVEETARECKDLRAR
jgi:hypothetical protein